VISQRVLYLRSREKSHVDSHLVGCVCDLFRNAVRDAVEPPFVFWGLGCRSRSVCFFAVSCVGCAWLAVSCVSLSVAPLAAFLGKSVHVSSAFEVVFLCCFLHAFLCSCAWWAVASWLLRMHPWVEPSLPLWLVSVEVEHAFSELLAP